MRLQFDANQDYQLRAVKAAVAHEPGEIRDILLMQMPKMSGRLDKLDSEDSIR
jgi:hypothetical protein